MIPTQRPPELTTGTPGSSFSRSVRSTASTVSSGATVGVSVSMMSATVSGTGAAILRGERLRQRGDHVGGDHRVRPVRGGREPAGADVGEHGGAGGVRG